MTNDMNPLTMPEEIQEAMIGHFEHAMNALGDTISSLHQAGMEPPAMASALAAAYARYVAALMAIGKHPASDVLDACKSGLDMMQGFVDEVHAATLKGLTEKGSA